MNSESDGTMKNGVQNNSSNPSSKGDLSAKVDNSEQLPRIVNIRSLSMQAPIDWLKKGWMDMVQTRFQGMFYGLIFVLMGYAISWIYATKWQLTMGLIGGFFLMGPFLCTGIYDLSRQLEKNGKSSLIDSLICWSRNFGSIAFFAIILTFLMIVWARVSLILFALVSTTSFPTVKGLVGMIFSIGNPEFLLLWSAVGFVFASIVFAVGVIAVPLMLDRQTDTVMAIFGSARSVHKNPKTLYLWAFLVVLIIGSSLAAWFVPLLVTAPLIGHATWHAYRDLVLPESDT